MNTIEEVASIFKVHFRTIYRWINENKIKSIKIGNRHYIANEELEYIKQNGLRR